MYKNNRSAVLRMIYENEGISRKEIAACTGLTSATITNLVSSLLENGYLVEAGEEQSPLGRKPIRLQINRDRHHVVGIELSADSIVCVLADFSGRVVAQSTAANAANNSPQQAVASCWRLAKKLLTQKGVAIESILGVGIMTSGPYDRESGMVLSPPNFTGPGWDSAPLKELLARESGLPVYLDRDSVGCALAEFGKDQGGEAARFAIMVNTVGIGGGMLLGRDVFYGQDSGAAEIGHMTIVPDGPPCGCGDKGCLEAVASGQSIARALAKRKGCPVSLESLVQSYRQNDPDAQDAVRQGARFLGLAIGNIIKCLSPERIAVGGRFITLFPEYYDLIHRYALERRYIRITGGTKISPFSHGEIQSAVGAVHLVINEFYTAMTR